MKHCHNNLFVAAAHSWGWETGGRGVEVEEQYKQQINSIIKMALRFE